MLRLFAVAALVFVIIVVMIYLLGQRMSVGLSATASIQLLYALAYVAGGIGLVTLVVTLGSRILGTDPRSGDMLATSYGIIGSAVASFFLVPFHF